MPPAAAAAQYYVKDTTHHQHRPRVGSQLRLCISDEELETFNGLYNLWGRKPDTAIVSVCDRTVTDKLLDSELGIHADVDPDILQPAFVAALNTVVAKAQDDAASNEKRPRGIGGASMLSCFRKVLRTEIDDLKLNRAKREAEARAEIAVQQHRLNVRVSAVNEPRPRGASRAARSSLDDIMSAAFTEEGC